jgi:hypothetical protein
MRLWIAIVAGLSMGQSYDPEPLPPEDPSVRDPAAAALQDAYEQAASDRDGARPPQGFVLEAPSDPTEGNYNSVTLPLPDGSLPATLGEVAVQQSQKYVPPPVPTYFDQEPSSNETGETAGSQAETGTGGAGSAGIPAGQTTTGEGTAGTSPSSGPTSAEAPGYGGSYDTGSTSSTTPGSVAPSGAGQAPLDTSRGVQEPGASTTATGTAGAAAPETATGGSGTTGTGAATPEAATGGSGTTGSGTAAPEVGTGGSGNAGTGAAIGGSGTVGTGAAAPSGTMTQPPGGTSAVTPSQQTTQGAQGQAQTAQQPSDANAAAMNNEEVTRLRQRIADLEQEMEARDTRATERTQSVQSQVDTHEQRAYEAERARQQRLARIQSGGQWMLAADQALEQGELNVDNALGIADEDFSVVVRSASTDGQGNVVVHSERIRAQIAYARDAAARRDVYAARIALQSAGEELRLARAASLERAGTSNSLLNP